MQRFRQISTAVLLLILLLGLMVVRPVSAAVLFTHFSFSSGMYHFTMEVSPVDFLNTLTFQLCSGASGTVNVNGNTNVISFSQSEPFAWVTTDWVSNGVVTAYSGACASSSPSSAPAANFYKSTFSDDEAGFAMLTPPKNGSISYAQGTCSEKCIIQPNLPGRSKNSLPSDATSTIYVRIAGEGGAYTVCFNAGELAAPLIYRYVSGLWISQPVTVSGGKVCTNASADGAFALGGS